MGQVCSQSCDTYSEACFAETTNTAVRDTSYYSDTESDNDEEEGQRGINLIVDQITGEREMHQAVKDRHINYLLFLIENKADINCQTRNTLDTPLHIASKMNDSRMIRLLLSHNADTTIKNSDGLIACQLCSHQILSEFSSRFGESKNNVDRAATAQRKPDMKIKDSSPSIHNNHMNINNNNTTTNNNEIELECSVTDDNNSDDGQLFFIHEMHDPFVVSNHDMKLNAFIFLTHGSGSGSGDNSDVDSNNSILCGESESGINGDASQDSSSTLTTFSKSISKSNIISNNNNNNNNNHDSNNNNNFEKKSESHYFDDDDNSGIYIPIKK